MRTSGSALMNRTMRHGRLAAVVTVAILVAGLSPVLPVIAATRPGPLPPVLTPRIDPSAAQSLARSTAPTAETSRPTAGAPDAAGSGMAPTEVPSLRTAYSDTYDNHDGTFTVHVSPDPINYQPTAGAAWTPIDLSFAPISGGSGRVRAGMTPVPVEVGAPGDAAGFVSVDTGEGVISLRLVSGAKQGSSASEPVAAAGGAKVAGLLPGVDLQVSANPSGFNTFLAFASRPASPSFTFELDSPGLTPALQPDGSISFLDKSGMTVATMPHPYAEDSTPDDQRGSGQMTVDVVYSLATQGATTLLTVSVDPTWLASAVYPVYVDPSVNVSTTANMKDTFVDAMYPTENWEGFKRSDSPYYYEMLLGEDPDNSTQVCKDLLSFTMPAAVASSTIDSATLQIFPYWQYEHYSAVTTWVDQVTSSWSAGSVDWNNQPSITTTGAVTATTVQGTTGSFDITSFVQGWVDTPSTNYGIQLNENGNGGTYWKRVISSEQTGANIPTLAITYSKPTATVSAPTGNVWTNSRTLTWAYTSTDGPAQAAYDVQVATDSGFTNLVVNTGSQSGAASSYAIPSGTTLTNGTTYYWRVEVSDGHIWSAWTAAAQFRWDATAPAWKGFTAPAAQVDQSAASYTFAWNAATDSPGSGVAGYSLQVQTAAISSTANVCSTTWSNSRYGPAPNHHQLRGFLHDWRHVLSSRRIRHGRSRQPK